MNFHSDQAKCFNYVKTTLLQLVNTITFNARFSLVSSHLKTKMPVRCREVK